MTAIVYHFFPHYREAVLRSLAAGGRQILLVGSPADPRGSIKALGSGLGIPFRTSRGWYGPFGLYLQPGAVAVALDPRVDTLIMLGDAHFLGTWAGGILGRLLGKRVLFWTHGYTRRDRGVKWLLRRIFYGIPHGLLLYGQRAKQLATENGIPADKLHVVYNSLDYPLQEGLREACSETELDALRMEYFGNDDVPVVLFCARLTRRKRFDMGVDAIHRLQSAGKRVNLLVVGDGPELVPLQRLSASLGIQSHFTGGLYAEKELARCFMMSAVTISPGEVGLTAMHSMAYGRPVITHNDFAAQGPEVEAIIDGVSGRLFKAGDVESLASAIAEFTAGRYPAKSTQSACVERIRNHYHPGVQASLIEAALKPGM